MKNKWHEIIRERLKKNRKECLACLYPEDDYEWNDVKRTLKLLNNILKDIPENAWPKDNNDGTLNEYKVASNNWSIRLGFEDGRKVADLRFRNNDHTAWVIEHRTKKGQFIDFDIGGS